jgi:hypothetical protein
MDCGFGAGNQRYNIPDGQSVWFLLDPKGFTGKLFTHLSVTFVDCLQDDSWSALLYTIDANDNLYPGITNNPRGVPLSGGTYGPASLDHDDSKRYLIKVTNDDEPWSYNLNGPGYHSTEYNLYWWGY